MEKNSNRVLASLEYVLTLDCSHISETKKVESFCWLNWSMRHFSREVWMIDNDYAMHNLFLVSFRMIYQKTWFVEKVSSRINCSGGLKRERLRSERWYKNLRDLLNKSSFIEMKSIFDLNVNRLCLMSPWCNSRKIWREMQDQISKLILKNGFILSWCSLYVEVTLIPWWIRLEWLFYWRQTQSPLSDLIFAKIFTT